MKHSNRLGYGWGMDRHKKPQERSRYTFPGANTLAITINRNKKRTLSYKTVQRNGYEKAVGVRLGYLPLEKMKKPLKIKGFHGGRNRTRTCDPIDVNDVLWAIGQVVKLKYGREHTSEALEIWAFLRFGLCSRCLCSGCVQLCSRALNTGVFRGVQGVFTALLCSFFAEHGHGKSLTV